MRLSAALATGLACVLLVGCGSSDERGADAPGAEPPATPSGSIESLWRAPGEDVALVPGTSDYEPGENRVSFLVVDDEGRMVEQATARVWVARALDEEPILETSAQLEAIGVPGGATADASALYVTTVELPAAGKYWLLAEPVGGPPIQALGNLVVGERSAAPGVGDPAPRSDTPTLASTGGDLEALSTARVPSPALYRSSVADAIEAGDPFVVSFATPLYCETRTCGPVVDVLDAVRKRFVGRRVRFIHVEVYEGNDPANGVNRWVGEWRLPTEPFTFVVDARGTVRTRLEGAFSVQELEDAVRGVLP
jgi:hypothetical protein